MSETKVHPVKWFALNVNPEPWAVGPLGVVRRGGKMVPTYGQNAQLAAYKSAIREELESKYSSDETFILPPYYMLDFFFWRNRAGYKTPASRAARKNEADATNMQKATEDALQGILIGNDKDVLRVSSTIMAQGPDVPPGVVIRVQFSVPDDQTATMKMLPEAISKEVMGFVLGGPELTDNSWPPR